MQLLLKQMILLLCSSRFVNLQYQHSRKEKMKQITHNELSEKIAAGEDLFLVDVRERFEHEEFNIGGILIPLGDVISKVNKIPTNKPVIIYCRKGIRSQIAIQRLEEKFGFTNLYNLQGGIDQLHQNLLIEKMGRSPDVD